MKILATYVIIADADVCDVIDVYYIVFDYISVAAPDGVSRNGIVADAYECDVIYVYYVIGDYVAWARDDQTVVNFGVVVDIDFVVDYACRGEYYIVSFLHACGVYGEGYGLNFANAQRHCHAAYYVEVSVVLHEKLNRGSFHESSKVCYGNFDFCG